VKRDTLLAVALALLAVVALGVAAATLDSAVSLGGGGFGGVEGDTPSAGDGPGDPGFSPSPGGDFALATQPLCYEFLREPPALLVLFGSLVGIAAIVYRDTRSALPALAAAGAVGFPIGLIWWGLATCGSVSDESEFELGIAGSDEGLIPEGAAGGTGAGGGEGAASAPELLFALVVIAALVASVGVLLLAGGDDEATPGSGAAAENDPDEPEPDLATVGRTAGQAADRIESSDADNEVYRAWRDMTAVLDVDRPASSTPAEFAAAGVDAGVDEEPVETLTEVFERVRYGGADATDDREQRAIAALRQIEERHGAGDSESHGDSTHSGGKP
jgi:hypothetical protein